ncbi:Negative regulator of differentiation 1 [Madurella fahalii]|uniref:Negative regulator of differentiation 1 n=1 Tax=Madurella fahalii TaxID=1157608 RepID=A0ABQ0GSS0_9PEZI
MSSPSGANVTIDREYFDTLVRRARFNTESSEANERLSSIVISRAEYDSLMSTAKRYGNLRRNLLRGGVGEETVDLLSQDDDTIQAGNSESTPQRNVNPTDEGGAPLYSSTPQPSSRQNGASHGSLHGRYHERPTCADDGDDGGNDDEDTTSEIYSPAEGPPGANHVKPQAQRQQFERQCTRTVQLANLAEGTTHADITNAVRGGMLLDVFLRSHERCAAVSFLHSADARKFHDHVRRHDLYIRNKRIEVKWNDRQFVLPGHVAGKIAMGATRNLVIQGYDSRHTEETIREDLDHIHNLVVVKVEFIGGNCYISLNSVHNAIYARQCMQSRLRYKHKKLDYDIDECAQPYPPQPSKLRKEVPPPKKTLAAVPNRFQLLNLDDGKEDEITAAFTPKKSVGITA